MWLQDMWSLFHADRAQFYKDTTENVQFIKSARLKIIWSFGLVDQSNIKRDMAENVNFFHRKKTKTQQHTIRWRILMFKLSHQLWTSAISTSVYFQGCSKSTLRVIILYIWLHDSMCAHTPDAAQYISSSTDELQLHHKHPSWNSHKLPSVYEKLLTVNTVPSYYCSKRGPEVFEKCFVAVKDS